MEIDQYRIQLTSAGVVLIEVHDEHNGQSRLDEIAKCFLALGASPLTRNTFVLPGDGRCSSVALANIFAKFFAANDQAVIIADNGKGIGATAFVSARVGEGVTVQG